MKRLLLASLFTAIGCAISPATHAAPIFSPDRHADLHAQIYLGDTPMATTYGRGTVTAPADTATLNYTFSRYDYSYGYSDPSATAEVSNFSLDDRDQILAFFVAQGIPPEQIDLDLNPYDLYVTLEISNPDQASLLALEDATRQFTEADGSFYFTNSYSTCSIEEFTPLEMEARLKRSPILERVLMQWRVPLGRGSDRSCR